MKITEDKMNWTAANDRFPPIKSQRQIDSEYTREIIGNVIGAIALFVMLLALMYMPKWVPLMAGWWHG